MMELPISEKYMLTVKEAAAYFNIGEKKMRRMAEDNVGAYAIYIGNRYLIIRSRFEAYLIDQAERRKGGPNENTEYPAGRESLS